GFDAVTGRLILMYLPDPADALRRAAALARPGAVICMHELDLHYSLVPPADTAVAAGPYLVPGRVCPGWRAAADGAGPVRHLPRRRAARPPAHAGDLHRRRLPVPGMGLGRRDRGRSVLDGTPGHRQR